MNKPKLEAKQTTGENKNSSSINKDVIEVIYKKKLDDCLAYQAKFGEKAMQLEFKAPKQTIKSATKKTELRRTKKTPLDRFGFESSDRPHIERWIDKMEKDYWVWFEAVHVKAESDEEAIEKAKVEIRSKPIVSDVRC